MQEPLPNPYKVTEDAVGDFEAFIKHMHGLVDEDVNDFAAHFVARTRPDLAGFIRKVMQTDEGGGSIDALEETPEYELYYSMTAEVCRSILLRLLSDYSANIFGPVQHREAQRQRALVGAP